jgi:uncharacterized membrane protein
MQSLVLLLCIGGIIALWVGASQRSRDIAELRHILADLQREMERLNPRPPAEHSAPPAPEPVVHPLPVLTEEPPVTVPPVPLERPRAAPQAESFPEIGRDVLERQFGGRAFVWIGGIALALAGFFLVKYSIETGLLTEKVRVVLGVLFGLALLTGSHLVRRNPQIADGTRIAQALAGAGIADLYGSLFAATTLYHLIPPWLGFAAMAAVTAAALALALLHGAPIAVLGLVGGYATPVMIQGDPNTPLLFGYLYLVCAGLTALARQRKWWWLFVPSVAVAFLWVFAWLALGRGPVDSVWLSLFLLAIGATAVAAQATEPRAETGSPHHIVRNVGPGGSLLLMAAVSFSAQFGMFEWATFGLFSLCALLLAWFDDHTYRPLPWLAMAANLLMLSGWLVADPVELAVVVGCFAALFAVGPQVLIRRTEQPVWWAALSATATLGYFLFAFARLNPHLVMAIGKASADVLWAGFAVGAAALFALAVTQLYVLNNEPGVRRILQAIYAIAATTLLSLGLAIILAQQYLPFAAAGEVFALSWIAQRTDIPALRPIAVVLTALFAVLLLPALTEFFGFGFRTFGDTSLLHAIFRFGIPAVLFAAASLNWRKTSDDPFVHVLEAGSVMLVAGFLYRLLSPVMDFHTRETDLVVSALYTNILLVQAIATFRIARRFQRPFLSWSAVALVAVASLRMVALHLGIDNPLLSHQWVGAMPIVNGILFVYGVPVALYLLASREMELHKSWMLAASIAAYALAAITLTLWVRQVFQGAYLDARGASSAEVYAYSAVWLGAGVALLMAAVARKDAVMRVASLVVMLLTVGKVFLFDASQLTGLWRVVSFLGLGLSLLGLSWFYSRFVFVEDEKPLQGSS